MCGIAGRFSASGLAPDPEWVPAADRLLAHRGPDGSGSFIDPSCEFVHRRLALLDLSDHGRQPMGNEDGQIQVVFNGEIYNWAPIRDRLIANGHTFSSRTDSEVLVHLYEERGDDLVRELRGMFAFAIYDRRRRRLLLARDRFGIKPLYYADLGQQLVFASEIKAILAVAGFAPTLDRQACYDYLALSYVPEPATAFREIRLVPPGHFLAADERGVRLERYQRIEARPDPESTLARSAEVASERLLSAVRAQSVADVPVAALLSGGIDSSLLVAAYSRTASEPPLTFNVRFPDPRYDETPQALATAERYATRHRTVEFAPGAITPDLLQSLLLHFDQPFADSSLIPTYWVSQAIRDRGIVCAISGDGGDEAYGGYIAFGHAERVARLMALPGWTLSGIARAGRALEERSALGRQVARAADLARQSRARPEELVAGLLAYQTETQKERLVSPDARAHLGPLRRLFVANGDHPVGLEGLSQRLTEALFAVSLPGDMLRKVDMMSMRASIEVRVPMLDEDVVEHGLSLTHRLKTDGRTGKLVLRQVASEWLPDSVVRHRKQGFGIPLDRMGTPELHAMLQDTLLGSGARVHGVLDERTLRGWLDGFRDAGTGDASQAISREGLYQRVLIALALELWLRRHRLSW